MSASLLRPVDLKLARAKASIEHICAGFDDWCDRGHAEFSCELFQDRLGFRLYVKGISNSEVFDEWGIIVGEIMHLLRSSLDNLVFALARLHNDPPVSPRDLQFPIFEVEADFQTKSLRKLQNQLPSVAISILESIQPFQRLNLNVEGQPNTDPLVLIHWFNNIDKHRIPTVLLLNPTGDLSKSFTVEFYSEEDAKLNGAPQVEIFGYPLQVGSTIMKMTTRVPINKVTGSISLSAQIGLECLNGREQAAATLKGLHDYTSLVVNQFRGLF